MYNKLQKDVSNVKLDIITILWTKFINQMRIKLLHSLIV